MRVFLALPVGEGADEALGALPEFPPIGRRPAKPYIDALPDDRRHPSERKQMAVVANGRQARTLYSVVERFAGTCLVECRPVTGRTHQIRVHMAHLGHAVVGDQVYSGRQWRGLADLRHRTACRDFPRQALHAWRLAFDHPRSGERIEFEAAPPADLQELLALLRS